MRAVVAAAFLMTATGAAAQGPSLESPSYKLCMGETHNQEFTLGCITNELRRQEKTLNVAFQALLEAEPARKPELWAAERDWIRATRTRCRAAGARFDSSIKSDIEFYGCYLTQTQMQTLHLRQLAAP